jgi:hypothetical protein
MEDDQHLRLIGLPDRHGLLFQHLDARGAASTRAANKFLRCARYRGDINLELPVRPPGFFPSCARRRNGRVLTASAIDYNS